MGELLQFQVVADEEACIRFGADYERSIERQAYSALADKMVETRCVKTTIVDPKAENAADYERYGMRRYYRFSVLVGDKSDAQALVDAEAKGVRSALTALRHLLKQPNDYEGDLRAHFSRWLEGISPEVLTFAVAELESRK